MHRTAQLLNPADHHLRGTFIDVAIVSAKECGFEEVGQSARSEERPVLSAFKIEVRVFAGGIIHAHVSQAQTEGIASQRRDVAVMRNAEVAFKVGFDRSEEHTSELQSPCN